MDSRYVRQQVDRVRAARPALGPLADALDGLLDRADELQTARDDGQRAAVVFLGEALGVLHVHEAPGRWDDTPLDEATAAVGDLMARVFRIEPHAASRTMGAARVFYNVAMALVGGDVTRLPCGAFVRGVVRAWTEGKPNRAMAALTDLLRQHQLIDESGEATVDVPTLEEEEPLDLDALREAALAMSPAPRRVGDGTEATCFHGKYAVVDEVDHPEYGRRPRVIAQMNAHFPDAEPNARVMAMLDQETLIRLLDLAERGQRRIL